MSSPRATVVIVNYNGAHLLPACLDGVRRQDLPPEEFHTVVVDNASTDGSLDLLAERYPWVRVVASPVNTGFAGGNNLALREVDTPFVVLLNNDATPRPDWLRNLLAPFEHDERLGVVTGKVVFAPRFLALTWQTPGFTPGPHDSRELGAQVHRVEVDGRDVTERVMWERLAFGPEGGGAGRFRWTRPSGELLVPVEETGEELADGVKLTFSVVAETEKTLEIGGSGVAATGVVGPSRSEVSVTVPAGTPLVDVVNNVGGIVLVGGYGADRGFQEVDAGQYDTPAEVFTACGNGMAIRTEAGRQAGWFDENFFMYYEDTDLSWRLRFLGWTIRYEPTAVLRHIHSASSREWSPRWVFHVDRNRLLMLTKDATAGLAARAVFGYLAAAGAMLARALLAAAVRRRRPELRTHLLRGRIVLSYLRWCGPMLARRRRIGRRAVVSREEMERWLVTSR